MQTVLSIINKKFLTEMDLLRLRKALLMCRMAANSTFLVDKTPPGYSSKLEELNHLLGQLAREDGRKIILFSEWTTTLNLVAPLLNKNKMKYVRLQGSVPQKQRQRLVHEFQKDPECKVFLTTNAGATGLNLQAANVVINVDLPWNPAVLEQRISRAHRMGQKGPVQVFLLITERTIEENLLGSLSAKHQLAQAALDPDSDLDRVDLETGMEELKNRLELLLGTKPDAPVDESEKARLEREADRLNRREKVASAGGQLLSAAFRFLGEMAGQGEETESSREMATAVRESLAGCMERDPDGSLKLTVKFSDASALDDLASSLARLIDLRKPAG
jgi:superfamily II DNA/RNA helicase